jgi:hypothetical protein
LARDRGGPPRCSITAWRVIGERRRGSFLRGAAHLIAGHLYLELGQVGRAAEMLALFDVDPGRFPSLARQALQASQLCLALASGRAGPAAPSTLFLPICLRTTRADRPRTRPATPAPGRRLDFQPGSITSSQYQVSVVAVCSRELEHSSQCPCRRDRSCMEHAVKRFLYWPTSLEYAFPWIAGPPLYLVLGAFGLPTGKGAGLGSLPSTLGACVLTMVLLLSINGILLWTHMRPQFLTWGIARTKFCGTFLLLTVIYLVLSGVILVALGRAGMALLEPAGIDWKFTAQCVSFGLLGLWVVLSASAFWKTEEPGVSNLRIERSRAIRLVDLLHKGKLQPEEYRSLVPTLRLMLASAESLIGRLGGADLELLSAWRTAAKSLVPEIDGLAYADINVIRPQLDCVLQEALAKLKQTR